MSNELDQLADRHFRPDPQGVLADPAQSRTGAVLLHISSDMAESVAVQHLGWMLVNLLGRQFKVVEEIILDVPTVTLQTGIAPFGAKSTLADTLEECVRLVAGTHISVSRRTQATRPDVALVIGSTEVCAPRCWRLYADGWRYFIGQEGQPPLAAPQSSLSIGPYLCASHAAGEVFKSLRGMRPGRGEFITTTFASAWTMSCAQAWSELEEGPPPQVLGTLPHFYFAGAGAVAQAAALCMGSSGLQGSTTVVDKDNLDLTNDNRYVLSTRDDDGHPKVELMQAYLHSRGIPCAARPQWWQDFVVSAGSASTVESVKALERNYLFPIILSCVDKNEPRHALQNLLPQLLIGASTDGLTAKASIFDLGLNDACLKCHNPLPSRNAIIQDRITALRSLEGDERAKLARELGLTDKDIKILLGPGGCGNLSEADLDRFAAGSPEMSVGFVSTAAGVLLMCQLLRYLHLGTKAATQDGPMVMVTFARTQLKRVRVGMENGCDCQPRLRESWKRKWQSSYWG